MVFEISPSENFSPPPTTLTTTTRSYPHAVRRLCVGSEKTQVRSRHRVQVQSPFSTADGLNYKNRIKSRKSYLRKLRRNL